MLFPLNISSYWTVIATITSLTSYRPIKWSSFFWNDDRLKRWWIRNAVSVKCHTCTWKCRWVIQLLSHHSSALDVSSKKVCRLRMWCAWQSTSSSSDRNTEGSAAWLVSLHTHWTRGCVIISTPDSSQLSVWWNSNLLSDLNSTILCWSNSEFVKLWLNGCRTD